MDYYLFAANIVIHTPKKSLRRFKTVHGLAEYCVSSLHRGECFLRCKVVTPEDKAQTKEREAREFVAVLPALLRARGVAIKP